MGLDHRGKRDATFGEGIWDRGSVPGWERDSHQSGRGALG